MKLAQHELTLYSRRGCHLCDDMEAVLDDFSETYQFTVTVLDIDRDPALQERFNALVPALFIGEQEICHYFFDLEALKTVLDQHRP